MLVTLLSCPECLAWHQKPLSAALCAGLQMNSADKAAEAMFKSGKCLHCPILG
jgi:hypothetical protein